MARERTGRVDVARPVRRLVHAAQLAAARLPGHPLGRLDQGAPHAAPALLGQDAHVGPGHVPVLPAEHLEVGDADDPTIAPGNEAAMLLGSVLVERLGQALGALPSRTLGPALEVGDVQDGEPLVEGAAVGGIDRGDAGHAEPSFFCQNMPTPATSNPSMSLTAIIGAFSCRVARDDEPARRAPVRPGSRGWRP